jgi:hypothetical protein
MAKRKKTMTKRAAAVKPKTGALKWPPFAGKSNFGTLC